MQQCDVSILHTVQLCLAAVSRVHKADESAAGSLTNSAGYVEAVM